jgi:hypothetical protein
VSYEPRLGPRKTNGSVNASKTPIINKVKEETEMSKIQEKDEDLKWK